MEAGRASSLAGRMMSLKYTCVLFSGVVAKSGGGKLKSRPSWKPSRDSLQPPALAAWISQ